MKLVPILVYHSVSEEPSRLMRPFTVTPQTFRCQLALVAESGAATVAIGEFLRLREAGMLPDRPAVITFDDGFADFADWALPALEARGLASTLYVTTGFLDGRAEHPAQARPPDRMLHWSQLRELVARGVEIGAHSHTHPHLDTLSTSAARVEIDRCKALLEDELERHIETFAYPHGYSSPAVRRLVREAGYHSACAVGNTFSSTDDDRFALARLTVRSSTTLDEISAWLLGVGAPPPRTGESLRTRIWRLLRRARAAAGAVPARTSADGGA